MKINLTFKELERVAPATGVYPIHAEVPADLLTPVPIRKTIHFSWNRSKVESIWRDIPFWGRRRS